MRRFWDERAREDAFFFVDDRLTYRRPDLDSFWRGGEEALEILLGACGTALTGEDEVVEIGCGAGRMTRALAGRVRSVRALDVSSEMLDVARRMNPQLTNVDWLHGDGTTLAPVPGESADACVSHVVFQHIPDPEITLGYVREMGRVLRPGGWAAFQVSNDPGIHRPREEPRRAWGRRPRGRSHPAWLGAAVELASLRAAAADGRMAVERVTGEGTQFCLVLTRRTETAADR
jgi:SAM-dependent methyltransferase